MHITLTELSEQAAAVGEGPAIIQGEDGSQVSFKCLLESSRRVAWDLRRSGVQRGDRVGLIIENGPGFFRSLFAVLYAGGIAVPLALPSAMSPGRYIAHVHRVAADTQMKNIIVSHRRLPVLERGQENFGPPGYTLVDEDDLLGEEASLADQVDADSLAIIQYTSGSTSSPKGVRVTHQNAAAAIEAIVKGVGLTAAGRLGLWLPLYHDMGLVSALSSLASGISVVIWRPGTFLRQPENWFGQFIAQGCTVSCTPNFFFDYLADVSGGLPGNLDLSQWQIAFNGSETVQAHTVERFIATFGNYGFRRSAMQPVYGLAEATGVVTFPPPGAHPSTLWLDRNSLTSAGRAEMAGPGDRGAWPLVGVGRAVPGMQVRIAGADGADDVVGEIEIKGQSVTGGYFNRSGDALFASDGWLRTGDLGFFHRESLYIAGRIKDVIVVRGENYFAEDAETIVRDIPGVYRRNCVAVGIATNASQSLAIVTETSQEEIGARSKLTALIRSEISAQLGLRDVSVHLVPPLSLPRTTSGKVQRSKVRAQLMTSEAAFG
jgi:fatty-acyl-CoA synthase